MGMRVSCLQENLARGLSIVSRAVGTRSSLPVLSNILIATDNGRLRLAATNLEMGITAWIGASVAEDGQITVPARTLSDLVNTLLPNERVDLEAAARTNTLHLASGATKSTIKGIDATEFPIILEPDENDEVLNVPADMLRETIKMVAFSAAKDDSRPVLTGVSLEYGDNLLTMAAADGFRLSVREFSFDNGGVSPFRMIVPARVLQEVERVISDSDEVVSIILPRERSQVIFHFHNVDIVSQTIEGTFPDYRQIVPNNIGTNAVLYRSDLLRACKRADIFARESNHMVRVSIEPRDGAIGVVRITANSSQTGDNEGTLDASIEGDSMEIAFNVRYLMDVLDRLGQEQILLGTSRPDKPGIVRGLGDETYTHVVMPMHMQR